MLRWLKSSKVRRPRLGPLETELLHALRQRGDATVRELMDEIASPPAYTTVMTTLDRLYKKGLLTRSLEGRAFRYRAKESELEYARNTIQENLQRLLVSASDPTSPLSFLVDTVSEHDAALLDELERAVGRKKRALQKRETR
jgi:predicted transcriptional regulator